MRPTSITANRLEKQLSVVWEDDHTSLFSFALLRAGCPCAECRGGHDRMSDIPDPSVFSAKLPDSLSTRLKTILPVGSYAITPIWEDGHEYGIYLWGYLRKLCPCDECRQ